MANMERVASLFLVKTVYSALISLGVVLTQMPFPFLQYLRRCLSVPESRGHIFQTL